MLFAPPARLSGVAQGEGHLSLCHVARSSHVRGLNRSAHYPVTMHTHESINTNCCAREMDNEGCALP
jgi:hypothetical protein